MAKQAAKNINWAINSVVIEDDLSSAELRVTQETLPVTSFADTGPKRLVGNYDYELSGELFVDFASGQSDAIIFALIGSAGVASAFDPTGATAGANDPNYDSTSVVLSAYSIRGAVGAPVTGSFTVQGNAALTRAVA